MKCSKPIEHPLSADVMVCCYYNLQSALGMNKQQREKETRILLTWLNHVLNKQLIQLIQLWNGEILHSILSQIPQISLRPYKPNPCNVWQLSFTNCKTIYRSIEVFWTKVLGKSWQAHSYIDLLKFSKERNEDQIFELLVLVLGCCVQSKEKDKFIEPIYKFNQIQHGEFVGLLQKYRFEDKLLDNKVIQIRDLMTKVEVLEIENDNLEKAINDQLIELQLLQESINYLSQQNKKMKEELKAVIAPETQNFTNESLVASITYGSNSTRKSTEDSKLVEELKAKLHEDKQSHMKEVVELKQTIEFLKETISGNRRQRGVSSRRLSKGIAQRMQTDHPPCVSLVKYQQVVFSQTEKIKELTKSEADKKLEIQRLQKQMKEIKETKDATRRQKQKEEEKKGRGVQDYETLKVHILQGIKSNLQQYAKRRMELPKTSYIH